METVVYFAETPSFTGIRATELALESAARHISPLMARTVRFQVENSVPRLLARLRSGGAQALVIDARRESGVLDQSPALELLRTLFDVHDISGPMGREQTWVVVDPDERGAHIAYEAGRARIAGCLPAPSDDSGWRDVWRRIEGTLRRRQGGKVAICLAGGGIEGLFYELGVLRGLQHFLPDFQLHDADILCGISAGAILGGFLANGIGPAEITRGIQFGGPKLDRIDRLTIFDPNIGELARRVGAGAAAVATGRSSALQSLFHLLPTGVFAGEGLRKYLEKQLNKPGMADHFPDLPRKLYIGATDQDTAEHVLFGSPGWEHVPLHLAIRASAALTPFYAPQVIDGRYFMDGAFTRTTNVRIAVEQDATLVILIDPLVPIFSERPGYVASKGGIMVGMQGLKSLIHGRFDRAIHMLRAMYPHVAFHLFQPDGATMRVMAGSPMKFFYRTEIEEIAFRETVRAVRQQRLDALQNDFARHSIAFVDPENELGNIKRDLLDEASEVQVA